ncbi:MAG: hypothetical protein M0C28_07290 [Candidatus Moduliflexus flocculans]|nr:hypothetical protein [Candidatus Moduliflexus flocculans]
MFWFLYIQLYNLMPLFMRYVDPDAPDGALHPGQPDHDRRLPAPDHPPGQAMDAGHDRSCSGSSSRPSGMLVNVLPALLFADLTAKIGSASA